MSLYNRFSIRLLDLRFSHWKTLCPPTNLRINSSGKPVRSTNFGTKQGITDTFLGPFSWTFFFSVIVGGNIVLFVSVSVFSTLEQRMHNMEALHHAELGWIKCEQTELQRLLASQTSSIQSLQLNLEQVVANNSALYREQQQMHSTINDLFKLCSKNKGTQIGETEFCIYNTENCSQHTGEINKISRPWIKNLVPCFY